LSFEEKVLQEVGVSADDAQFYSKVSAYFSSIKHSDQDEIHTICFDEYEPFSSKLDHSGIQESTSVRNVVKARRIATKLISDDGSLALEHLSSFINEMQKTICSLMPNRSFDVVRDTHILNVLKTLQSNPECIRLIRRMTRPYSNRLAEGVIRDTLRLDEQEAVKDVHVQRAVLSAWLTTLRQSLGSCFATAPAILVQQEQPLVFLKDLDEMMNTGCMKKTFGGTLYSVPMSSSWGNGDLKKPIILERDLNHNENKIWTSPGLIHAMQAVSFFAGEQSTEKQEIILKERLQESIVLLEKPGHFIFTNAEELIRVLLLHRYKITHKEVDEYINRPKTMMQSSFIAHVPTAATVKGRKKDSIPSFLKDVEMAKRAFKMLADNALLKSWEFTLASFSEVNLDFARWNLYSSLGINFDDAGGIGHCLYELLSRYIEEANNTLKEYDLDYEQIAAQMRYLEGRSRSASTEKEISWLKMEYQSRQTELYHIEQLRSMAHEKATKISRLHQVLVDEYDRLFPTYFQEVYDAEIHDIAQGPYDDSPAGFRLIFKHGRANPSLWTKVTSLSEYIEALVSFFTITEIEIREKEEIRGIESEFTHIITQLVGHVRSDQFIETSFYRMAKAHKAYCPEKPLENLDKVEKKPWVYTSGGSMRTLVSSYFCREEKPTEVSRWVENETELLAFFIDTMRSQSAKTQALYLENTDRSMLMHSPTHAFLLKPGFFSRAWKSGMYSYSWIKKHMVEPTVHFSERINIDEEMGRSIIDELYPFVPQDFRPRFSQVFQNLGFKLTLAEFRSYVVNAIYVDRGLRSYQGPVLSSDTIDSVLYSSIPFLPKEKLIGVLEALMQELFGQHGAVDVVRKCLNITKMKGFVPAKKLLGLAKTCALFYLKDTKASFDIYSKIVAHFRDNRLLFQAPLIVADSNWVKDYFAFVVNPATSDLEFWSVDYYGVSGKPISYWKEWLDGSRREPEWGIYCRPHEYIL